MHSYQLWSRVLTHTAVLIPNSLNTSSGSLCCTVIMCACQSHTTLLWPVQLLTCKEPTSIATNVDPCPLLVLSTWLSLRMSLLSEVPVMCPLGTFFLGVVPSVVGIVHVITAAGTTLSTAPVLLVVWAHPVPVATSTLAICVVCAWAEATGGLCMLVSSVCVCVSSLAFLKWYSVQSIYPWSFCSGWGESGL